jgi:hypothetical protein
MFDAVDEFLKNFPGRPYSVEFVLSATVDGHEQPLTQIQTFLLAASSIDDARAAARAMIGRLSDGYNNSQGEHVTVKCLGIHRIIDVDYVFEDRWLQLANFTFSSATRPEHLIDEPESRPDLPELGQ